MELGRNTWHMWRADNIHAHCTLWQGIRGIETVVVASEELCTGIGNTSAELLLGKESSLGASNNALEYTLECRQYFQPEASSSMELGRDTSHTLGAGNTHAQCNLSQGTRGTETVVVASKELCSGIVNRNVELLSYKESWSDVDSSEVSCSLREGMKINQDAAAEPMEHGRPMPRKLL